MDRMYLTYNDMWKEFKGNIPRHTFFLIAKVYFALFSKSMIEQGIIHRLPQRLGYIGILKSKTKSKYTFDFPHYKLTGEKRIFRIADLDNYVAKFKWFTNHPQCVLTLKGSIKFKPIRANKRKLTLEIRNNNSMNKYVG